MPKRIHRITVQVLNGATGEMREVIAKLKATDEQDAVNLIFLRARRDDYYYRFLGTQGVIAPSKGVSLTYGSQEYWAAE